MILSSGLALMADSAQGAAPTTIANSNTSSTTSWDKNLSADQRFTVLAAFNNEAVRDNETGLVWEKSPVATPTDWLNARFQCTGHTVGGRKAWRLPSVHEFASLFDPNAPYPGPKLPAGHPFLNVQSAEYWSATTWTGIPDLRWYVDFLNGNVANGAPFDNQKYFWCVRGPMNADAY
jgi:uncharacterized protein DUF1566